MVRVDFGRGTLGAESGRGTTVADPEGLVACAKAALADVHPTGIAHDNQRYGVSYRLTLGAEDKGGRDRDVRSGWGAGCGGAFGRGGAGGVGRGHRA